MAYIVLQFGQCGNQLGRELFSLAHKDISQSELSYWNNTCARDCWFDHNAAGQLKARAVLVDTERKVVSASIRSQKKRSWVFSCSSVVSGGFGGAGNNFALGYSGKGPVVKDAVLELLRKESEKCDRVRGIVSLAGCAGGTGSGLGTCVLENVKDVHPHKNLISVLITPYCSGEVVTQNINTLFSISKQKDVCDAIILFQNDAILNTVKQQSHRSSDAFPDLNKVISQTLLSFFQPVKNITRSVDVYDLLSQLCPQLDFKFLTLTNFPFVQETKSKFEPQPNWNTVEREILRSLRSPLTISNENSVRSVANVIISRGEPVSNKTISKIKSIFSYPVWIPESLRCNPYHHPRSLLGLEKCITVASNSSNITGLLDNNISKAWKLFTNNMYVHLYYKFGFSKEDFMEMFVNSEKILKVYKHI